MFTTFFFCIVYFSKDTYMAVLKAKEDHHATEKLFAHGPDRFSVPLPVTALSSIPSNVARVV